MISPQTSSGRAAVTDIRDVGLAYDRCMDASSHDGTWQVPAFDRLNSWGHRP